MADEYSILARARAHTLISTALYLGISHLAAEGNISVKSC